MDNDNIDMDENYPYDVKLSDVFSKKYILSTSKNINIIPDRKSAFKPKRTPKAHEVILAGFFTIIPLLILLPIFIISVIRQNFDISITIILSLVTLLIGIILSFHAYHSTLIGTNKILYKTEKDDKTGRETLTYAINEKHSKRVYITGINTGKFTNQDYNLVKKYYPDELNNWKTAIIDAGTYNSTKAEKYAHNIVKIAKNRHNKDKHITKTTRNIIWEQPNTNTHILLETEQEITNNTNQEK